MPRRGYRLIVGGAVLAALGLAGWVIAGQVGVWRHLRAGKEALGRHDARSAREHLAHCVRAWPASAEAHFLAAQAARRSGELAEARRHLDRAAELGWVRESIDLERALWRAQAGELPAVENFLNFCLANDHPDA